MVSLVYSTSGTFWKKSLDNVKMLHHEGSILYSYTSQELYCPYTIIEVFLFGLKNKANPIVPKHGQSLSLSPLLLIFQPNHYVKYQEVRQIIPDNLISFLSAKTIQWKTLYSCYTLCQKA